MATQITYAAAYEAIINGKRDRNACTPIATAIATGIDPITVLRAYAKAGRQHGQGTYRHQQVAACLELGFELQAVPFKGTTNVTVERFLQRNYRGQPLIVHCTNHWAAWNGEKIDDWSQGRRKMVKEVLRLVPVNAPKPAPMRPEDGAPIQWTRILKTKTEVVSRFWSLKFNWSPGLINGRKANQLWISWQTR